MNDALAASLSKALQEVLENLCFMLPGGSLPPPEEGRALVAQLEPVNVTVEVEFVGARNGVVRVTLPHALLALVASAMLGDDEALPLTEQYDAARELANIVCGNALPLIAGGRAVFDLGSPRVVPAGEPASATDARVRLMFEEGCVEASIVFRDAKQQGAA